MRTSTSSSFRSVSGRTVAAFWWAASMIMIATYTANLAAFLTFSRMKLTINSVESLASQNKISYGTPKDSPPSEYFEKSILPSFNAMFQYMKSRGTLTSSMAEGFKRVREEDFAFIFDSIILHKEMYKKPCDVFTVGRSFGTFGKNRPEGSSCLIVKCLVLAPILMGPCSILGYFSSWGPLLVWGPEQVAPSAPLPSQRHCL